MRKILGIELTGFVAVVVAIWINELLDLPHRLFGQPLVPFSIYEALFESLFIGLLAVGVIRATRRLTMRVTELESLLPICSFCKRIRKPDADPEKQESWERIEHYIHAKTGSQFSHGLCPECMEKHYGEQLRRS
ncbi:MAG TPA: hypothetical protein PLY45_02280 [bacterium]|mgnify:CR=1 FL=1|nr:hypothetical protein [bacterium]